MEVHRRLRVPGGARRERDQRYVVCRGFTILEGDEKVLFKQKIKGNQNMLVWKIEKNKIHRFVFYENDNLSSFLKFKLLKKTFKIITSIGSSKSIALLTNFISHTLINNKKYESIDSTFVYQTKRDNRYIKNITDVSELDHIKFLPIKDSERLEKLYSEVLISSTVQSNSYFLNTTDHLYLTRAIYSGVLGCPRLIFGESDLGFGKWAKFSVLTTFRQLNFLQSL